MDSKTDNDKGQESEGTLAEKALAAYVSRRKFMQVGAGVAGATAMAAALAACGSGSSTPAPSGGAPTTAAGTTPTAAPTFAPVSSTPVPTTAATAAAGGASAGGQVIFAISQEPQNMNPLASYLEVERGVQMGLFDALWKINENGQFVTNLATEIPTVANGGISADGLSYTFKLRKDAKWHDGEPFTSKDVKFTHDTVMDPNFAAFSRVGHDKVDTLEIPDDYTVKITMKEPFAPFLITWFDTYFVPEHILSKSADINTDEFKSTKPVGTGPFKFMERVAGDHITVAANKDYHGGAPKLDKFIYKYVSDLTVLYQQFAAGDIDVVGIQGITADHYNEAKGLKGVDILVCPSAYMEFIAVNLNKPVFQDLAVRQALYMSIDKKSLIDQVYYGLYTEAEGYIPPQSPYYNQNLAKHEFNIEKAKQILEDAGWKAGADGVREKNGLKLAFTNSTTAGNKVREQAQQLCQQNWKQIGASMEIKNMPAAVVWGDYYTKSEFDSLMVAIHTGLGVDPDGTTRFSSKYIPAETGAGSNVEYIKDPQLDKLLEDGAKEVDPAKRKPIYDQVQQILRDQLYYLPLTFWSFVYAHKTGLEGYKNNVYYLDNTWNMGEWGWKKA